MHMIIDWQLLGGNPTKEMWIKGQTKISKRVNCKKPLNEYHAMLAKRGGGLG